MRDRANGRVNSRFKMAYDLLRVALRLAEEKIGVDDSPNADKIICLI